MNVDVQMGEFGQLAQSVCYADYPLIRCNAPPAKTRVHHKGPEIRQRREGASGS